jgi:S1-C subfamily serine protease
MDAQRGLLIAVFSIATFGLLGVGCGSGSDKDSTDGSVHSRGDVPSTECRSHCLPEGALSNGEKRIAERNRIQFEKFGRPASESQRTEIIAALHKELASGLRINKIGAVRIDGSRGYVLLMLHGHDEEEVVSVVYDDGRWVLAAARAYPLEYASPE